MLVLTRKQYEVIQIGDDVRIKIMRTGPKTVKIGIEAPSHVRVLRAELCDLPLELSEVPAAHAAADLEDLESVCVEESEIQCVA